MTTYQVVSDLHIENSKYDIDPLSLINPSADVLILAGDIGSFYILNKLYKFLKKVCVHFKLVIYVPGNHEYYKVKGKRPENMETLFNNFMKITQMINNLYVLNRSSIQINDICIVGCTLWSKTDCNIPKYIVRINEMDTDTYNKFHTEDVNYIKYIINHCKENNLKLMVVTHHCPTYYVINKTQKRKKDKYSSLYYTDLDYLLKDSNMSIWISGHLHVNYDYINENGVRLLGNQLGKPKDNITDFNKKLIITL